MRIILSKDQQDLLFKHTSALMTAEVDADCEPSGYGIEISFVPGIGAMATAEVGNKKIDLGDVRIEITE